MDWNTETISIGKVKELLESGYEVEVTSPDGWVGVSEFVDKGMYEEYILEVEDGTEVVCNADHLFQTTVGWMKAKQISAVDSVHVLTEDGSYKKSSIRQTGTQIPIVDIRVEHENHRYYTNGISSHNTGVGKSLIMCHMAAANLNLGHNVLYITLEMSEERIAERIDANLLDTPISEIEDLPKQLYDRKVNKLKQNVKGRLMIKEYPTASASATHFRALLDELKMKKGFTPDIIYVDYLNIATSSRLKTSQAVNMYTYVKSIAEELRGIAVEYDVAVVSATQTNRTGYQDMDAGLESTSESFGIAMTGDFIIAAISNEELQERGVYLFKQLKNRYRDPTFMRRFMVGVDYSKMRLYELENPLDGLYENNKKSNEDEQSSYSSNKRRRNFGGIKVEDDE